MTHNPESTRIDPALWKKEPLMTVHPDFQREWVVLQPMQYYVAKDQGRDHSPIWLCPGPAPKRRRARSRFYKCCELFA